MKKINLSLERWTVGIRDGGLLTDPTSPIGYFFPTRDAAQGFINHFQDESQVWEPRQVHVTVESTDAS